MSARIPAMASPPAPDTATGFLSIGDDGRLRFGVGAIRGWPWRLDARGIAEEVPEEELARGLVTPKSFRWRDLRQVSLRLRPTIALRLLVSPLRDFEYRLEVHTADNKGWFMFQHHLLARTDRRMHVRVLPALMQFLIATPEARDRLDDVGALHRLLEEVGDCLATSEGPPGRSERWPAGAYASRRELDAAAVSVLADHDVVLFAGRPVRGGRLGVSSEVVDAVLADFAEHCRAAAPPPDVVAAAVDAMQGPHPDWPFDVLT